MPFMENGWYCAARSEEIGEGSLARLILDKPILLTRDAHGLARAIGDMCPHRFAPLHRGERFGDTVECPYHGLRFDLSGACVHNPHGSGRIPAAAAVPSYPIVEQQGVVWLWPGDPALADPAEVVDLGMFPRNGPPLGATLHMDVDYRLVIDNLLDLSHAPYIHAGTLSPPRAKRESSFDVGERSVAAHYVMRDVETPSSQAIFFKPPRGDYYTDMEWTAPATLRMKLGMTEVGRAIGEGRLGTGAHLITPETATSTHYFWLSSRNTLADDAGIDARMRAIVSNAFLTEDEPMMAACQDYMRGRDFFALQPLYLETDHAGTRCRRILEGLIAREAAGARSIPAEMLEPSVSIGAGR